MRGSDLAQNMGETTERAFRGGYTLEQNRTLYETYCETADLFAAEIRKKLPPRPEPYSLLDIGAYEGELSEELALKLPDYKFKTTALDVNEAALAKARAEGKIVADAIRMPFADKSFDFEVMRYVLQWNSAERQKKILQEIKRTLKEAALIEHVGAANEDADKWRDRMDDLLDGQEVPKMKRDEHYFSSRLELEEWMGELGVSFERLRERTVEDVAAIYIERFGLSYEEAGIARGLLADKNFMVQTDWIILPDIE